MNRTVFRLAADIAPRVQTILSLIMWLVVGAQDYFWLTWHDRLPVMAIFVSSTLSASFLAKMPAWRLLPVSRRELGEAQWWLLWGRPLLLTIVAMAVAAGAAFVFHTRLAQPGEILTVTGYQIVMLGAGGLCLPVSSGIRRLWGATAYFVSLTVCVGGLLVLYFGADATYAHIPAMWIQDAAVIMLALLVALYPLSHVVPLAMPYVAGGKRRHSRRDGDPSSSKRSTAGLRGWAGFLPYFAIRGAYLAGLIGAAAVAIMILAAHDAATWLVLLPVLAAFVSLVTLPFLPQRVMAALPVPAWQRVVVMQALSPLLQAIAVLIVTGLIAVLAPGHLDIWIGEAAFESLALVSVASLLSAMGLRFGYRGAAGLVGAMFAGLGVMAGFLISVNDGRLDPTHYSLAFQLAAAGFVLVLIVSWLWTWLELTQWRAAYRMQSGALTRWRGNA